MEQLRTTDQIQREFDNNPQSRFAPTSTGTWGVQNAVLSHDERRVASMSATNENRSPQQRFTNNTRQYISTEQPANVNSVPRVSGRAAALTEAEKKSSAASDAILKSKAFFMSAILIGISAFIQTILVFTSTTALVVLGASWAITENWVLNATTKVLEYVGELFGFASPINLLELFMLLAGATILLNWLFLAAAVLVFKLCGIQSIGGETGAAYKKITFILAAIFGNIPIVNIIPLTSGWLWAVRGNPK